MDYFISDLHIGHNKSFLYEPRGFSTIEEHDSAIIQNWNSIIWSDDNVYILGDICLNQNFEEWDRVLKALKGKKFFIHGNHDTDYKIERYIKEYNMIDLGLAYIYKYSKTKKFYLSHYPTMVGNYDKHFLYNLSGHIHSPNRFQFIQYGIYNVSMDAQKNIPISIKDIIKDITRYEDENDIQSL